MHWLAARASHITISDMFTNDSYQLLTFGDGKKLEQFGGLRIERPCPVATDAPDEWDDESSDWTTADSELTGNDKATLRFEGRTGDGQWKGDLSKATNWNCQFDLRVGSNVTKQVEFELSPTPTGQVGLFPEQAENWNWIAKRCQSRREQNAAPPKILNLFAYTGGSTLAAAAMGAEVTHVDAAKSVVNWARRNAERSGLGNATIRWIVEDAAKYVAREVKRGKKYDGIILDPPSYGHGPKGEEWKLSRDLIDLLGNCKQLLSDLPLLFLLSCHTPGFGEPELSAALSTCLFGSCGAGVKTRRLDLSAAFSGEKLFAGYAAYWP